ncbi:MAG TPA: hypothetical protein VGB94_08315 [Acidobacteriaceae bacterium]
MDNKTPSSFSSHDEWLSYVRENIPAAGQPYALAYGRTELFKSFYELRKQAFPIEFTQELKSIHALHDPERTNRLESLNQRIFASLTAFLLTQAQPEVVTADAALPVSPREQVQELLDYLTSRNPYFALWTGYKNGIEGDFDAAGWEKHLCEKLGPESQDDIAFTRSMVELDKLLLYCRDRNLLLPRYFFERCWFLHCLRGRERMLQTRAVLDTLTAEIAACVSA